MQVQFKLPADRSISGSSSTYSTLGLEIKSVATASSSDLRSLPPVVAEALKSSSKGLSGARVVRHAIFSGLAVYWRMSPVRKEREAEPSTKATSNLKTVDYILEPSDCAVRLAVHPTHDSFPASNSSAGPSIKPCPLEGVVVSRQIRLRIKPSHLSEMERLADILDVANRRCR